MSKSLLIRTAAVVGFVAVALGAFGAHKLKPFLIANDTLNYWETAVLYQFVHLAAFVLLALTDRASKVAYTFFLAGIIMFSGSLYLMSLLPAGELEYPFKAIVFVTPLGGLFLLGGWVTLFVSTFRSGTAGH